MNHRNILIGALVFGLLFLLALFGNLPNWQGPFLVLSFLALGLGVRGFQYLKGFSYTIFILAAVAISMYYPEYFLQYGSFELKSLIVPLLQIIMFGMGSQLSMKDFGSVIQTPKAVIIGVICQFSIMPLVALVLINVFDFPIEIAAGIVLVGTSPSGLASNVMSFLANANVALSVTLTAIATLLAPIMTPALMQLLIGQMIPVDFWNMMLGIMDMVILPIVAGLLFNLFAYQQLGTKQVAAQVALALIVILGKNLISYFTAGSSIQEAGFLLAQNVFWFLILPILIAWLFKRFTGGNRALMNRILLLVSMIGIGVIIVIITAAGRDSLLEIGFLLILACLIQNLLGYSIGYWICKLLGLEEKSCRTIALEVGMQNSGLASGIAVQMGKVATVGLAPSVFGPMMNITGSSLAIWWRERGNRVVDND